MEHPPRYRLGAAIAAIPRRNIISAGRWLGNLAYAVDARHRLIVRNNLSFAYPELPACEVRKLSRCVFQNMALTFLEICQMSFYTREDFHNKVRIQGEEYLRMASESPNGSIMITAHLGNWEMSAIFACCFLQKPLVAIARNLENRWLGLWINRLRTRFGNTILDKRGALPKMARTLRNGNMLGILIDQATIRAEGVEVLFFGKTVTTTPAAALLARRYNAPVIPAFCIREPDGHHKVIVEPPLNLIRTEDSDSDLRANTQLMTSAIEKAVRVYPEQWLWFHKRWKRHYPYLYKDYLSRKKKKIRRLEKNRI
jgi:Kdo2-lipid IVA lauroyltransferase/acyltransferase